MSRNLVHRKNYKKVGTQINMSRNMGSRRNYEKVSTHIYT
jgi:hypothetical protein